MKFLAPDAASAGSTWSGSKGIMDRASRFGRVWRRPSAEPLSPEELPEGFLDGSDFLLLDGLMADVSVHAAQKAREASVPVMLDAGRVRERMLAVASLSDYVVGSDEFGRELGWNGDRESFKSKAGELTPGVTTITLGERGSVTYAGDEIIAVPACEVDFVDTTGAGDVFHGGYIYGLLQGWDILKTVRFATAMAALKCRARREGRDTGPGGGAWVHGVSVRLWG